MPSPGVVASIDHVVDVVVATDPAPWAELWRYREAHTEVINTLGPPHKLDVTLPLGSLAEFVDRVTGEVGAVAPTARTWLFGHVGDGNIHVNVTGLPRDDDRVDEAVLHLVGSSVEASAPSTASGRPRSSGCTCRGVPRRSAPSGPSSSPSTPMVCRSQRVASVLTAATGGAGAAAVRPGIGGRRVVEQWALPIRTFGATTEDGEVMRVDGEPELALGLAGQFGEELISRFDPLPAPVADEVGMGVRGQQVGGRPMAQMGVLDDAQLLELLQIAVDGREMDIGGPLLHRRGQGFGRQMAVRVEEDLEDDPP